MIKGWPGVRASQPTVFAGLSSVTSAFLGRCSTGLSAVL